MQASVDVDAVPHALRIDAGSRLTGSDRDSMSDSPNFATQPVDEQNRPQTTKMHIQGVRKYLSEHEAIESPSDDHDIANPEDDPDIAARTCR